MCGATVLLPWNIIGGYAGPDSVMVRASASGAGGRRFEPGSRHTKDVKNGGYLAWRSAFIRQALASLLSLSLSKKKKNK